MEPREKEREKRKKEEKTEFREFGNSRIQKMGYGTREERETLRETEFSSKFGNKRSNATVIYICCELSLFYLFS